MSSTELHWPDVMADAIEKFNGQTCRPADERTILGHFQRNPMMVIRAIDDIAAASVTWYWSALAARLERSGASSDVSVSVGPSREQAVAKAEAWLRNAGALFDRWSEVEDELFGDRGRLRAWAADQALRERMEAAWEQARPSGEQDEADELERGAKFVDDRVRLAEAARAERERLDAAQAAKAEPVPAGVPS